jgi:tRNA pseudouridine38-40 synthase
MAECQRVAALVEYDGTDYAGFQLQKGGPTIQGELEAGLMSITGQVTRVIGAGRTDAGVHAQGQVVHLQPVWAHPLDELRRAWNANLPSGIAIRAVVPVSPEFHARFSARSRVYRYQIYNACVRSPLSGRYAWHVERPLDAERMAQACAALLGRRDLASFGAAPQGNNTVRTVLGACCWAEGACVYVEVEADAFLQHMMRRIVATLVPVGLGRMAVEEFGDIVSARDLSLAVGMAPGRGLCLLAVRYDPAALSWSLPSSELWQKESLSE